MGEEAPGGAVGVALLGLADAFLNAPFLEHGWDIALRLLAEATGSARGQLIGIGGPAAIPFNLVTDTDERALGEFIAIDGGSPERNFRVAASGPPLEIIHEAHYEAAKRFIRDDVYDDFCRDYDIPHGIQTVLEQSGGALIGLAVNRTAREGRSSAEQRAVFAGAVPHALRAVRLQQAMEGQAAQLLRGTLETMSVAAFVLDFSGTVRAMTGGAEAAIAAGGHLLLSEGRLQAALHREQPALDGALRAALRRPGRSSAFVSFGRPHSVPAAVAVHPLGVGDQVFGFAPGALLVLRGERGDPDSQLLRTAYGLTSAEAAVAVQIAHGLDREQIARSRGVSAATIHSQLKAIFDKMGVRREVELVLKVFDLTRN